MFQVEYLIFQKLYYLRELRAHKSQNLVGESSPIHRQRWETKKRFFTLPPSEKGKPFLFTYNFVILRPFIFNLDDQIQ
jgi:hypothetical protein